MTVEEWLTKTGLKQSDLVKLSGETRQNVSQAKRLGHLVIINSDGKACLVPARYRESYI